MNSTTGFLKLATAVYKEKLASLATHGSSFGYDSLLSACYMKEKHWKYAIYMATLSTLPVLHRVCSKEQVLASIVGKASVGASTKLLDNLNDEIQTLDEATRSLEAYERVMIDGDFTGGAQGNRKISSAENSAFVIASWTGEMLRRTVPKDSWSYQLYATDVRKLVRGQIDSLLHKSEKRKSWPSIREYLSSISEKSIGDVWFDVDLCFLEAALGKLNTELLHPLRLLKVGNSFVFKSSLVYDDAQDLSIDLMTNSVNCSLIQGLERGVISLDDLARGSPQDIEEKLEKSGILLDTIRLADLVFLTGVKLIQAAAREMKFVDSEGLLSSYRFVRLFNLRKILMRSRDLATAKLFASSLGTFDQIARSIPDDVRSLQRFVVYNDV